MPLVDHPRGNYRFLPGIAPYSCGVVSQPGFEIVHATLACPMPYHHGFDAISHQLDLERRPREALCAIELRSPAPFTFQGFADLNADYAGLLRAWNLFVGEVNPIARTNVAPAVFPPAEPVLHGFSYTRPCDPALAPTFVVAGAGELPEGLLAPEAIVCRADVSRAGIASKASFVLDLMENRLRGLGVDASRLSAIDVYTIHSLDELLPAMILRRLGGTSLHAARWYYSRPPIQEIEFEMDLLGVRAELRVG